jgi:dipeptidyl-peptidase 4
MNQRDCPNYLILASVAAVSLLCMPIASQSEVGKQPAGITLDEVCNTPGPVGESTTSFRWSPDGKYIGYLLRTRVKDDIQVQFVKADAATGKSQILLEDDAFKKIFPLERIAGVENRPLVARSKLADYLWSPDSASLLFYSGSSLVLYSVSTGKTRQLLAGTETILDPQISPDGSWISFIRDHNIWAIKVKSGAMKALTHGGTGDFRKGEPDWLYRHELGLQSGYWWSPDSTAVAYLQFDEAKVTKYSPPFQSEDYGESEVIHYPKPSEANPKVSLLVSRLSQPGQPILILSGAATGSYLPRVKWFPDGSQLSFEILDRSQTKLDLFFANPRSGASKLVLTDKDQYWINLSDDLYFLRRSKRFIWSSERTGYRHLSLYSLDGTLATALTHGNWEVTSLQAVDETSGTIFYTGTQNSPLERQLYSTDLHGGNPRQLTAKKGDHEVRFADDSQTFVDTYSTVNTPPEHSIYKSDGTFLHSLWSSAKAQEWASNLSRVEFLTMKTHDGTELNGMLIKPPAFHSESKYPVIVYVNGGPGTQVVRDAWVGDRAFLWNRLLAQNGFVIFAVDNRGSAGRGHVFEEYIHLRFGGQEMSDQLDGLTFLRSLSYIDSARIGLWGRGFGGALTVQGFLNPPLQYKAGFALAPIVDWTMFNSAFVERYLGNPVSNQDGYSSSSPLDNAKRFKGPLLIAHGTSDEEVHPDQSMELQHELLEVGKSTEIMLLPGQDHNIADPNACGVLFRHATDFFLGNL